MLRAGAGCGILIIVVCNCIIAESFCFPPVLIPVVPWFWTAKAIAPGWSSAEFSPLSCQAKVVQLWHRWGSSWFWVWARLCSCLRFSHRHAADPGAGPAPETELKEIPSSCLRSGLRFAFGVHEGDFFACKLNEGVSGCCFLTPGRIFFF